MSRFLRLSYVLPRLIAIVLLCFVVDFGLARALRWGIVRNGGQVLGAKIDVGQVQTSILGGHVTLLGMEVANPYTPRKNLLEADAVDCTFDSSSLLQKQFVVDRAAIRGLSFGTSRENGGQPEIDATAIPPLGACIDAVAAAKARVWLEAIHKKFGQTDITRFESIRLAEQMSERWPERYGALEPQVADFKVRAQNFQRKIASAQSNPLRHSDFYNRMPGELESLRQELATLNSEMESLASAVEADRRLVDLARREDEQLLRHRLQLEPIDPKALTAYLMQEQLSGPLGELMGWLHWVRRLAPEHPIAISRPRRRGVDIPFADRRTSPDLLIRAIDAQGTLSIARQPIEFIGRAIDVSTQPHLHQRPMHFDLSATAAIPLRLIATVDRTGAAARDELTLRCQNVPLPRLQLGEADRFRLSIAPSRASVNVQIILEGDRLSGGIRVVQQEVELTPEFGGPGGRTAMNDALQSSLPHRPTLVTELNLSGTLSAPRCELWSDLGPVVAAAFGQAVGKAIDKQSNSLAANTRQEVGERLARADQELMQVRRELQNKLDAPRTLVNQLVDQIHSRNGLSVEGVSRRTTSQSLVR